MKKMIVLTSLVLAFNLSVNAKELVNLEEFPNEPNVAMNKNKPTSKRSAGMKLESLNKKLCLN